MKLLPTTQVMRLSLLAFVATLFLALFSMGFLGLLLYYMVSPVLNLSFPDIDSLHGDWIWPAIIVAGMVWAFGFLIAGKLYLFIKARFKLIGSKSLLITTYTIVLVIWALVIWTAIFIGRPV
ncbi:hypothetical protein OO007_16560 [Cocleimonas sp. KMM 6892]|uniref:hypothetical protein n=1 Tax=unclassified Cocleimonas TaxID=2639732 RepID=UPI002DB887AD|nr:MULTISPECIES: hypothetical protein [unclassified Cocleimonas]MEB8433851.1 hypothetical protein [Cocleimonas sp. KMM 6892]MEC4716662.1 hypothetical protein [Cocleimonas sp. KMM 6895]MEC4746183.1 hypothetical protein [Cocleimonas sp. KMM 6896]